MHRVLLFAVCVAGAIACGALHQGAGSVLLALAAVLVLGGEAA
jgi:hypothetical protein